MTKIGTLSLTSAMPLVCVPIMGHDATSLAVECKSLKQNHIYFDVIEWRIDHYKAILNDMPDADCITAGLQAIREQLDTPVLVTFRTKGEGGVQELSQAGYMALLHFLVTLPIDAIDIEYFQYNNQIQAVMDDAKKRNITVIMSNHDFQSTPPAAQMYRRLEDMKDMGADVAKIAVMPQSRQDVLALLSATATMADLYPDYPLITMSMGKLGVISRISGQTFGSCLTFGAAGKQSAPGQLDATVLQQILKALQ